MVEKEDSINLQFSNYEQEGLYLHFEDSSSLVLTSEVIEQNVEKFWGDPTKILPEVKESDEFLRCSICPGRNEAGLCDGLGPILPFLEYVDKYNSFDKVVAIYRGKDKEVLNVATTTMQTALSYVAIQSLFYYCLKSREYWRYYVGVVPLSGLEMTVARIYLNIYWLHKGNEEETGKAISKFQEDLKLTTKNQVKRLNLICNNDAFINAFVGAQVTTEFLSMDIDGILEDQIGKQNI